MSVFSDDKLLYKPGLVNSRSLIIEKQNREFFKGIVFWCASGGMPGDFGLQREGDVFFQEGDAVFAGVGGGGCGYEG